MEKEEYLKLIELLKENIEEYDISIEVEPQIEEHLNFNGTGIRTTKYIRTITIIDKEPIVEKIERKIWN